MDFFFLASVLQPPNCPRLSEYLLYKLSCLVLYSSQGIRKDCPESVTQIRFRHRAVLLALCQNAPFRAVLIAVHLGACVRDCKGFFNLGWRPPPVLLTDRNCRAAFRRNKPTPRSSWITLARTPPGPLPAGESSRKRCCFLRLQHRSGPGGRGDVLLASSGCDCHAEPECGRRCHCICRSHIMAA